MALTASSLTTVTGDKVATFKDGSNQHYQGTHLDDDQITTLTPPALTTLESLAGDIKTAAEAIQAAVGLLAKLTDTQPVSLATVPSHAVTDGGGSLTVDGSVTADTGLTQPLTDTELRASAVPVGMLVKVNGEYKEVTGVEGDGDYYPYVYVVNSMGVEQGANSTGNVWRVETIDCYGVVRDLSNSSNFLVKKANVSASSSGDNTIVAAVTGKKIVVISMVMSFSGAVNAKFQSGASGTDKFGLIYGATGSLVVVPYNKDGWFETASGALLNLNLSSAVAVTVCINYIEVEA